MTSHARRLSFYNTSAAAEHYLGIRWPRAVWEAVLTQAVNDVIYGMAQFELQGLTRDQATQLDTAVRGAAQDWIDDRSNEPRRFVWVCEQLDLEPSAVRAAVQKRRQQE